MYWFRFRRTSPWSGNKPKVFFFAAMPPLYDPRYPDMGFYDAVASYTRAQLVALVEAGKAALEQWPEDI